MTEVAETTSSRAVGQRCQRIAVLDETSGLHLISYWDYLNVRSTTMRSRDLTRVSVVRGVPSTLIPNPLALLTMPPIRASAALTIASMHDAGQIDPMLVPADLARRPFRSAWLV